MSRAVVLQDGDDHRDVGVHEAADHPERDQGAVLAAADHSLARAMGELTGARGPVQLQASCRVGHRSGASPDHRGTSGGDLRRVEPRRSGCSGR